MKFNIKKIWSSLVQNTINNIFWVILVLLFGAGGLAWKFWPGFKKWLKEDYPITIPVWAWIVTVVFVVSLPVLILKAANFWRKRKISSSNILTDDTDIFNKLYWWLGQQQNFVRRQTENDSSVTWHFNLIDKRLGLKPGSAKQYLPQMLSDESKLYPIKVLNKGEKTISIYYERNIVF